MKMRSNDSHSFLFFHIYFLRKIFGVSLEIAFLFARFIPVNKLNIIFGYKKKCYIEEYVPTFEFLMGKERANRKAISNDTPKIFRKKEDMKE